MYDGYVCIYITGIVLDNTKFGMNKNGGLINRNCGIMGQHFFFGGYNPKRQPEIRPQSGPFSGWKRKHWKISRPRGRWMVPFWCLSSLFKWGENHPMTRMVAIRRDILLGASLQSACYRHDEVRNPMGCLFFHSALEVNPVSFSRYVAARIWLLGSCLLTQPKYYIYIILYI